MPNIKVSKSKRRDKYFCIRFNDEEMALISQYKKKSKSKSPLSTFIRSTLIDDVRALLK